MMDATSSGQHSTYQDKPPLSGFFHFYRGLMDAKDMIDMPEQDFRRAVVERFNAQGAAIQENTTLTKAVAEDTAFIRSILDDVAAGARLMCRLAAAWKFLLRQVFIPVVLPLAGLWTLICIVHHQPLPDWVGAGIKLILAIL
jgi:hypothetical protein